jgi:2-polyprenyl-3-methyl-5-hydroxy-6-metoxy-1,4-benzoquinol methylase
MEPVSRRAIAEKRGFYRQAEVAETYDARRFGGASGAWVNARELALVRSLLPGSGRILDLGAGTGRLSQRLVADGCDVVMLDASEPMLARARRAADAPVVLGDAFALPLAPGSFDAVVALRVVFHFAEFDALLHSVAPLLRPGGRFIFDTYRWTPRALLALASHSWGGKVFAHRPSTIARSADRAGLRIAATESCFLFSPYGYRLLPLGVVRRLDQIEKWIPPAARARVFWALERPASRTTAPERSDQGGAQGIVSGGRGEWPTPTMPSEARS